VLASCLFLLFTAVDGWAADDLSPSKVRGLDPDPASRRRAEVTSREVGCCPECCERRLCGLVWLPAATSTSRFPERRMAPHPASSPDLLRVGFILSSAWPPLQSTTVSIPAPCTDARRAFLGVLVPHRGINRGDPLATGVPPPTYGPPSAFPTPSTVCSLHDLGGLFHPPTTSGIRLPGVFPATQPVRLSTTRALVSLATGSCPGLPRDSVTDALAFRALIRAAIRCLDAAV
jgi:hypothetical protein